MNGPAPETLHATAEPSDLVSVIGRSAPFLIAAYGLLLLALRLFLSPHLDAGEAALFGRVDMRWAYEGAPPLRFWLTRVALVFTDWDWPQSAGWVNAGALALFYFSLSASARMLGGPRAAGLALIAAAFFAPISWLAVVAPSGVALALAFSAASLHAALRAMKRPSYGRYAMLGAAIGAALLTRFESAWLLIPLTLGFAFSTSGRRLFRGTRIALAGAAAALMIAPTLWAAFSEGAVAPPAPAFSEAGARAVLEALGLWIAAAAILWLFALLLDRAQGRLARTAPRIGAPLTPEAAAGILFWAMMAALALAALATMFGLETQVALAPILAPAPLYLALRWPLGGSSRLAAGLAAAAYLAGFAGLWGIASYGAHRFALPYDALSAQIRREAGGPTPIIAQDPADAANVVLALGWPGARSGLSQPLERRAILLWRGRGEAPADLTPRGFGPAAAVATVVAPYANGSGAEATFSFQRIERLR